MSRSARIVFSSSLAAIGIAGLTLLVAPAIVTKASADAPAQAVTDLIDRGLSGPAGLEDEGSYNLIDPIGPGANTEITATDEVYASTLIVAKYTPWKSYADPFAAVISVFELFGLAYTGSSSYTAALCLRKHVVNGLLERGGLPIPPWTLVRRGAPMASVGFPAICKPAAEDASELRPPQPGPSLDRPGKVLGVPTRGGVTAVSPSTGASLRNSTSGRSRSGRPVQDSGRR